MRLILVVTATLLLASCGQNREQSSAATVAEEVKASPMVRVGEEEFCDEGTVRFRQQYSNDGGATKVVLGVRTPEPRKRC